MKTLTENDPIDFGKYKGKFLNQVPASYLLYCYRNDRVTPAVRLYIARNYMELWQKERHEKNNKKKKGGKKGTDNSNK